MQVLLAYLCFFFFGGGYVYSGAPPVSESDFCCRFASRPYMYVPYQTPTFECMLSYVSSHAAWLKAPKYGTSGESQKPQDVSVSGGRHTATHMEHCSKPLSRKALLHRCRSQAPRASETKCLAPACPAPRKCPNLLSLTARPTFSRFAPTTISRPKFSGEQTARL